MTWPLWADWRNVTCNDNKQIPCKNRTIYEILVDFNEFLYKEMANDTVLHKFIGGRWREVLITSISRLTSRVYQSQYCHFYLCCSSGIMSYI